MLGFKLIPGRLKVDRIYLLCVLKLPQEIQDKTGRADLIKSHGAFLLGFNVAPVVGGIYPYQGNLWELVKPPAQFPHRYQSQQTRQAPIALFKWVGRCESVDDFIQQYLED